VDPGVRKNKAIRDAAKNGHADVVALLLDDSRVDPGAKNNRAIRDAAENGHADVVELLAADPRVDASVL
jgi:hypothetical protein